MAKIIGIDLGTTNSVVSVMEGDQPKVLINSRGNRITPSVVAFTDKGERLVGEPARHQQVTNPKNTVFSVKRFMGRRHNEIEAEEKTVPYEVTGSDDEYVKIKVREETFTPEQVSAFILGDLKKTAEDYLGETVTEAVVTVPAYFNDAQRQATKQAGEIAGLKVLRVLPEPTAAALAFGTDKKQSGKIFVFDLGGGTFDVSVLDIDKDGDESLFEVLSIAGDTHLGGDDFDEEIIDWLAGEFKKQEGIDLRNDPMALQRLKEAAEKAKKELSSNVETNINLPFITADQNGPKHLNLTLTRSAFEGLIDKFGARIKEPVLKALEDAKLKPGEIDDVLLVGGSTRIPFVQKIVKDVFGKEPNKSVNPDEVVAMGAAVQGGIAKGDVKDILVLDATPLSLGVETLGGVMTKLIERNTTIPTSKSETFSTAADSQTTVTVRVLQGEREFAKDNRLLGEFNLNEIPPAPRGVPQIEVTFNIDVNGILSVKAIDKSSGKEASIEVKGSGGLSDEEVERMKREAEQNAEADKARREVVDLRNQADGAIASAEKLLTGEDSDKIPADVRSEVESAVNRLKEVKDQDDADVLKKSLDNLNTAVMKIGEAAYAASQAAAGGPEATAEAEGGGAAPEAESDRAKPEDDDVIDAEYEVKKE
ncbi:MAG: molecular chaperone DnaK [Planctomycetota bacterium]